LASIGADGAPTQGGGWGFSFDSDCVFSLNAHARFTHTLLILGPGHGRQLGRGFRFTPPTLWLELRREGVCIPSWGSRGFLARRKPPGGLLPALVALWQRSAGPRITLGRCLRQASRYTEVQVALLSCTMDCQGTSSYPDLPMA
jgi:hypothetical protein